VIKPTEELSWYVKRLSTMGPMEILYRVREQCFLRVMQMRHHMGRAITQKAGVDIRQFKFCVGKEPQLPNLPWSFNLDAKVTEDLLAGHSQALGLAWTWRPERIAWHEAPDTGKIWPQTFFGSIPYRGGNPYGDVRIAWEPSRLQHLIPLGLLAKHSKGETVDRAIALLEAQILSWVEANPLQRGIHYISAMECALRILSVSHAMDLARTRLTSSERAWDAWLTIVKGHAEFIKNRLSLYSSSGNHTIAECAGLVYAGVLLPELEEAEWWKQLGLAILEREARHQILLDGGGVEQSSRYLLFIVDLYGLVVSLLEHQRQTVPPAIRYAYTCGRLFLNTLADSPEELPAVGDSDSGHALSPLLRLCWGQGRGARQQDVIQFEDSGYTVIRGGDMEQITAILDHGPLGMIPSYGHGHADALSMVLRWGKEEILIDPGTYTYNGDINWRSYFRGTRAHNTVTVDGLDQAVQETAFMWSHPYTAKLARCEETLDGHIRLLAYHDGYSRRGVGVEHWRALIFHPPGLWLIWDYLAGEGIHTLDLHWHCSIQPVWSEKILVFSGLSQALSMAVEGGETTLHRGETDSICGWRSRMYGVKEPITTVRTRFYGLLPHEFVTQIWIGRKPDEEWDEELSLLREWINEAQKDRNTGCTGRLR
jgi:hypothetical protein